MRPSKFRFPESTLTATRFPLVIALITSPGSGPELPMQVVHPYPTTLKPSLANGSSKPAFARYSVTTLDPGARLVLTYALIFRPRSYAFLATNPAAIITDGLDVLVHEVIAAITTAPWVSFKVCPFAPKFTSFASSSSFSSNPPSLTGAESVFLKDWWTLDIDTLSCGRFGPARLDSTVFKSSSTMSLYSGAGELSLRNNPCSLQYHSTRSTVSSGLPVSL